MSNLFGYLLWTFACHAFAHVWLYMYSIVNGQLHAMTETTRMQGFFFIRGAVFCFCFFENNEISYQIGNIIAKKYHDDLLNHETYRYSGYSVSRLYHFMSNVFPHRGKKTLIFCRPSTSLSRCFSNNLNVFSILNKSNIHIRMEYQYYFSLNAFMRDWLYLLFTWFLKKLKHITLMILCKMYKEDTYESTWDLWNPILRSSHRFCQYSGLTSVNWFSAIAI